MHHKARIADAAADQSGIEDQGLDKSVARSLHDLVALRLLGRARRVGSRVDNDRLVPEGASEHDGRAREGHRQNHFKIYRNLCLDVGNGALHELQGGILSLPESLLREIELHQALGDAVLDEAVNIKKRQLVPADRKAPTDEVKAFVHAKPP